jgi:hypothetical protein
MYIKRTVEKSIKECGLSFPCIVIYGPRQVGKSTTVNEIFGDEYRKVTLDDTDDRLLAEQNPKLFLENYGCPLIIDEIQKVPKLLDEIKKIIDEKREQWLKNNKPRELLYILTGSNRFELQEGIADSLAGRCGVIEMASFTMAEKYGYESNVFKPDLNVLYGIERSGRKYKTRKEIFEDIFTGGMPDICTGVAKRDIYFKAYINTYIEKDILKLIAVSSELQFRNFLSVLALRTAQELHYDEIANSVGIDVRTCKKWLSILQTSGIVYLLQPYMANVSKRIIKSPKIYFMDTGLCAYLCKWQSAEMISDCAMSGAFFETFVVSEIVKNLQAHNIEAKDYLYYYRDIDQKEVDLLYVTADALYPIEIKKSVSPVKPTKNFSVLSKFNMEIKTGLVIDTCDKIRPINEKAYSIPVYLL